MSSCACCLFTARLSDLARPGITLRCGRGHVGACGCATIPSVECRGWRENLRFLLHGLGDFSKTLRPNAGRCRLPGALTTLNTYPAANDDATSKFHKRTHAETFAQRYAHRCQR